MASLALLAAAACSVFSSADRETLSRFRGQMLNPRDASGIEAMRALQDTSEAVRLWMVREGTPDYLLIESRRSALLFYIERDQIVRFQRPLIGGSRPGQASRPIRADHYMQFANADRERLARARMGQTTKPGGPSSGDILRKRVGADSEQGASSTGGSPQ